MDELAAQEDIEKNYVTDGDDEFDDEQDEGVKTHTNSEAEGSMDVEY